MGARHGLNDWQRSGWGGPCPPVGRHRYFFKLYALDRNLPALRGQRLKDHEDTLDALFCAYLAWHCWRWGAERSEMIGTLENGYIVVPKASD